MRHDIAPEQLDVEREIMDPNDLVGADWNPNEMTEAEFTLLKENISEVGFIDPPTVAQVERSDGSTYYEIVSGHHRAAAAKDLGLSRIPVDVLQGDKWQEVDVRKFQNVRANVIHGKMNPEKMVTLYNEMSAKYGEGAVRMFGYTSDDGLKKLIKQVSGDIKKSMSPELADQFEHQAKEARTVGDLDKIIQKFMSEGGDTAKYGFVVFTWGGKEHIYVAMSDKTRESMKRIVRASRSKKIDINEVIEEAIVDAARGLEFYDA